MGTNIKSEKVNRNSRRIWGSFKLTDGSTTKFEMLKGDSWNQWNNTTSNLCLTVDRVKLLCEEWLTDLN